MQLHRRQMSQFYCQFLPALPAQFCNSASAPTNEFLICQPIFYFNPCVVVDQYPQQNEIKQAKPKQLGLAREQIGPSEKPSQKQKNSETSQGTFEQIKTNSSIKLFNQSAVHSLQNEYRKFNPVAPDNQSQVLPSIGRQHQADLPRCRARDLKSSNQTETRAKLTLKKQRLRKAKIFSSQHGARLEMQISEFHRCRLREMLARGCIGISQLSKWIQRGVLEQAIDERWTVRKLLKKKQLDI